MAKVVLYCIFSILLLPMSVYAGGDERVPITSCDELPYPSVCHSLAKNNTLDLSKVGFRESNLRGAISNLRQAILAASSINADDFDRRTKSAWEDCLALSNQSMEYLENSLRYPSNENTQTWLSRISINHRTCTNGFSDFNISVPAIALNISSVDTKKFISNLLAINKASMPQKLKNNHDDDRMFPEWLDIGDRRLLRSKSVNADLVVAKDGSGNFMTITEALTASVEKREGGGRFVVYIKEGVYSENVEITNIMTNLMFVGDGIDRTVVTGSRNVVDGATTFNSATVGMNLIRQLRLV